MDNKFRLKSATEITKILTFRQNNNNNIQMNQILYFMSDNACNRWFISSTCYNDPTEIIMMNIFIRYNKRNNNLKIHRRLSWGSSASCFRCRCKLKSCLYSNAAVHRVHLNFFVSPRCRLSCTRKWSLRLKRLSQNAHANAGSVFNCNNQWMFPLNFIGFFNFCELIFDFNFGKQDR